MKRAIRVGHHIGELTGHQDAGANLLEKIHFGNNRLAWMFLRVKHTDLLSQLFANDP
jgi:hypothetical protein